MKEEQLVERIKTILEKRGCWTMKTHGSFLAQGNPDLIASCPFKDQAKRAAFVAIEVKVPGKIPTKLQLSRLSKIRETGAISIWTDDPKEVSTLLDKELA